MEGSVPLPEVAETNSMGSEPSGVEVELDQTSTLVESEERVSMPMEWTDEKHSLYLKSMEASFVNRLYNSWELLNYDPEEERSSGLKSAKHMHAGTHVSSGQYKVLRDGCLAKVNFRRGYIQLNNADESHLFLANPWIQHFRYGYGHRGVTSYPALKKKASLSTTSNCFPTSHFHSCCQDSAGCNTEVTDQNFVDEDTERDLPRKEDAERGKSSGMCCRKKMKTSVIATSSTDQVVPFVKFPTTEDVAGNHISLTD